MAMWFFNISISSRLSLACSAVLLCGCPSKPPLETSTTTKAENSVQVAQTEISLAEPLSDELANEVSVSELRKKLNANQNAKFEKVNGRIVAVSLVNSGVTDISPLKGLKLKQLELDMLEISDLSPLAGMPLETLYLTNTKVKDLSPLAGMNLDILWLEGAAIEDLTGIKNLTVKQLNLNGTRISSIEPLRGMTLDTLWIPNTAVSDLSPLKEITLISLDVENTPINDLTPLANHPQLNRLNIAGLKIKDFKPLENSKLQRLVFSPELCEASFEPLKKIETLQEIGPSLNQVMPPATFWPSWPQENSSQERSN